VADTGTLIIGSLDLLLLANCC